jgi:RNA polymerase sigma-70 factor (ECF subfamily)
MEAKMKNDEELMMEYMVGNMGALEEIFQRYKKPILNYALRLLKNLADAEDAAAEAFCTITSKKDAYRPEAKFSTWFYTITHNICIDKIRKRKKTVFLWFKRPDTDADYEMLELPDTKPLSDTRLEAEDTAVFVKKAIDALPLELKEAIILREYHNLNYEEISRVMQCSIAKVKILIFRAREKLKNALVPVIKEAQ